MQLPLHYFVMLVVAIPLLIGCTGKANAPAPATSSAPTTVGPDSARVVKIAVMKDGTVFVNSEAVAIESLAAKLDALNDIQEVWYHRESPEAAEPHENAMKAIEEIAKRRLPIAMYLDREFTQRATFGN